jgi:hypothetical protein
MATSPLEPPVSKLVAARAAVRVWCNEHRLLARLDASSELVADPAARLRRARASRCCSSSWLATRPSRVQMCVDVLRPRRRRPAAVLDHAGRVDPHRPNRRSATTPSTGSNSTVQVGLAAIGVLSDELRARHRAPRHHRRRPPRCCRVIRCGRCSPPSSSGSPQPIAWSWRVAASRHCRCIAGAWKADLPRSDNEPGSPSTTTRQLRCSQGWAPRSIVMLFPCSPVGPRGGQLVCSSQVCRFATGTMHPPTSTRLRQRTAISPTT